MKEYQELMVNLRKSLRDTNAALNNLSHDDFKELVAILFEITSVPDWAMDVYGSISEVAETVTKLIESGKDEFLPMHFKVACSLLNEAVYGKLLEGISLQQRVWTSFFRGSRLAEENIIGEVESLINQHTLVTSKSLNAHKVALEEIKERFVDDGYIYVASELDVMEFISLMTYASFTGKIGEVFNKSLWDAQYKFLSLEDTKPVGFNINEGLGNIIYFIKKLNIAITGGDFSESNPYIESNSILTKPYLFERDFVLDTGLYTMKTIIDLYMSLLKGTYSTFDFYGNVGLKSTEDLYTLKETTLEDLVEEVKNSDLFTARPFTEDDEEVEEDSEEVEEDSEEEPADEHLSTEESSGDEEDTTSQEELAYDFTFM